METLKINPNGKNSEHLQKLKWMQKLKISGLGWVSGLVWFEDFFCLEKERGGGGRCGDGVIFPDDGFINKASLKLKSSSAREYWRDPLKPCFEN